MKKIFIYLICVLSFSCISNTERSKDIAANLVCTTSPKYQYGSFSPFNSFMDDSNPYNTKLRLQPSYDNRYNLVIDMELNNGAHFVSPNSKRNFKGKFTVTFENAPHIKLIDGLIEYPLTVEEHDDHPFVNGKVNWVRENTTYTQKIKVKTNKDFTVNGFIQFTIEPRCTLEKIPIVIFQDRGKLKFEIDNC